MVSIQVVVERISNNFYKTLDPGKNYAVKNIHKIYHKDFRKLPLIAFDKCLYKKWCDHFTPAGI